ncbi:GntR family transcriptional regulator [Amycolatopsis thermoflava]|uniref:GntR family transcriptional regulator n=1 Tax=Amycolatopsis thermoflava TaxID=84480 RepID=UPI00365E9F96
MAEKVTAAGQVYEDLRGLLLSGSFEPGTRLTEADLTRKFTVSRGTIRSVLVRLVQEGYVTSEVNRGVRTRSFTLEEAADILEARETLEAALAGNRRFHQQVKEAAHQATLARTYDTLLYPLVMRQYRNISARHPRAGSLHEHQAILLAIATRNPEAATAAMRHHVGSARRALLLDEERGR